MKNKRRIVGIVAAMILATIGTVALVGYVQSAKDKAVAAESTVSVYVVDTLVPKGAAAETIKASVSLEQVPSRLEQPGALRTLDDVGANVAATDLQPGDQLVGARLVAQDEVAVEVKDKVQIATPVLGPERAVGGALKKGDLVGVYLSFDNFTYESGGRTPDTSGVTDPSVTPATVPADSSEESSEGTKQLPNLTHLEFQHVLVTNVQTTDAPVVTQVADSEDGEDSEQQVPVQVTGSQYIVTLALSPEQSERFVFAAEYGHVWLSSQPATVVDDGTRLVTLGNTYAVVR
jgi:pilus assembly protein CpaB